MKIRDLYTDESKWTQGVFARDADGRPCSVNNEKAARWCLGAAIIYVYGQCKQDGDIWQRIMTCTGCDLMTWNDTHTFAEVKALVDRLDI